MYSVKSNTIKDLILDSGFNPDTPFIMVLIEESKSRNLAHRKVAERIASMPLDKFFDCLGYVEEDVV